mmetsp:Transcript_97132/g.172983  ORF Transcript_97132/g.172983 Transcript_97132/m.172983 type:complete len:255 (+) Transcript_97132:760-1524(+)
MFCSKSQHFTSQSSEALKRYGCLSEMATERTALTWPVKDSFSVPLARSQILIKRSLPEEANHSFVGSTATVRTQPSCPDMTRMSFHGGCQIGLGISGRSRSGRTMISVDGSLGFFTARGRTGPTASPGDSDFPVTPMSVSICVMADGLASLVASSAMAKGFKKGSACRVSPEASSGTSFTASYSSCTLIRIIISVPAGSSGRFSSALPQNMSWVRFSDFLTASVTGVFSLGPNGSACAAAAAGMVSTARPPKVF